MKKAFLVLLSAVLLLFSACESWMQDDNFYSDIENDVKVANAKKISVYVSYAMTRQGKTSPEGFSTFKVEIPHEISASTEPEYGFVRWAAFSRDFLATGENQNKNKDIYYVDAEDYKTRLEPHEIKSPTVVFRDATKPSTTVTINKARSDIFLVPIVAKRPAVALTIPAIGSKDVVRNMSVRISFTKAMDPDSFKNEAGEYDKITITQGTQTFTADGDIEISSQDISDRFEKPKFSKNQKMITLQFKPEALAEGYASQSSVNITVSKEVKDTDGFTMVDDEKISFTAGSNMDTLAPRITALSAGRGKDFAKFKGMYKDKGVLNKVGTNTQIQYEGATAPLEDSNEANQTGVFNSFYNKATDTIVANRVTNKIIIRAFAEDIAGSGEDQSQTGIETDVSGLGVRAKLLYDLNGNKTSGTYTEITPVAYVPQANNSSLSGSYKELIQEANTLTPPAEERYRLNSKQGCLFDYDLTDLPDGLIQIDVAAVDLIGNSGFADGGNYSDEYGNSWASIFVVKDTTPPDPVANSSLVLADTAHATNNYSAHQYFNKDLYTNYYKINGNTSGSLIKDKGNKLLTSTHDKLKWIIKPTSDTAWAKSIKASDKGWKKVSEDYTGLTLPGNQGEVVFTYALMDDLGNISQAYAIPSINYDSVNPVLKELSWVADSGSTEGIAKGKVLDNQTLVIPVNEETSGITSIDFDITKDDGTTPFDSPLDISKLTVEVGGYSAANQPGYTVSGKTLKFNEPVANFNSNIKVHGLTISSTEEEDAHFTVKVTVKDTADNWSQAQTKVVNIDSKKPVIDDIYIPNINKAVRYGSTSPEYWIDYTTLTVPTGTNTLPRTDIYVKFNEKTSGAKVFNFAGSSVSLTTDSKIYKVKMVDPDDPSTWTSSGEIASTVNTSAKTLTIKKAEDAVRNVSGKNAAAVKITNVELPVTSTTGGSTVKLVIKDTATNDSGEETKISSKSNGAILSNISNFNYDSGTPTTYSPVLKDKETESGCPDAVNGYTNNKFIKASMQFTSTVSGISSLEIDSESPAVFVKDASAPANNTTITSSNSSTPYDFDVSADGKTLTFKQTVSGSEVPAILGSSGSNIELVFNNLKLTGSDGSKTVKIKAKSLSGRINNGSSGSITLDETPPAWVGDGIYTKTNNDAKYDDCYPHPSTSPKSYGVKINDSNGNPVLHFYVKKDKYICLTPDMVETNKKTYTMWYEGTRTNGSSYKEDWTNWTVSNSYAGTYEAYLVDKAGNISTTRKKLKIVVVDGADFTSDSASIDNYMTFNTPDSNSKVFRNTSVVENSFNSSTFNYEHHTGGSRDSDTMNACKYVIRKTSDPYTIKIKLGTGVSTTDTLLGGTKRTSNLGAYDKANATTSSAPIEYYSVSHWYSNYSYGITSDDTFTNSFVPYIPDDYADYSTKKCTWHKYEKNSGRKQDTDIYSYVDNSGDIVIELPKTTDCPPLALCLKDGCGNITYRNIRPSGFNSYHAVAWIVDGQVGLSGFNSFNSTSYSTLSDYMSAPGSDVTFYKLYGSYPALVTFGGTSGFSDNFRFDITSSTTGSESEYSMRSRLLAWTGSSSPTQTDFHNASTPQASTWHYMKEKLEDGHFNLQNYLPKYVSTDTDGYGVPYKLYYIIEDYVGNCEIKQFKNGSREKWLYDATAPEMSVSDVHNVNTIDGKNYYSNNSSVDYTITDKLSGIKNKGDSSYTYSNFSSCVKEYTPTSGYSLNGKTTASGGALSISGVADWAGNTADSVPLVNGGSSVWVRQQNAPTLSTTCVSVAKVVSSQPDIKSAKTTNYGGGTANYCKIEAKKEITDIKVTLYVTDTEQLLGWWITSSALTTSELNSMKFITPAQLTENNTAAGRSVTYTSGDYVTTYEKRNKYNTQYQDNWSSWKSKFSGETYFYPVNRAGLISSIPVVVTFEDLPVPVIKEVSEDVPDISYSGVVAYTDPKHDGANKENFIKSGSKIIFEAANASKYVIVYGSNETSEASLPEPVSTSTIGSGQNAVVYNKYELSLSTLTGLSQKELKLRLNSDKGETCEEDYVLGVTKDNSGNVSYSASGTNKWTYDNTAPTISFYSFMSDSTTDALQSYNNNDSTMYFKGENAIITFCVASDVEEYMVSENGTSWTTIDSSKYTESNTESNYYMEYTFAAPDSKKTYYFKAIDKAENETSSSTIPHMQIQRDDQAPDGNITAKVSVGNGSDMYNSLKTAGLIKEVAATGTEPATVYITYSSVTTNTSSYINKLDIDLSDISDAASGLYRRYVSVDGGTASNVTSDSNYNSSTNHYVLTLPSTFNGKTYEFSAEDNIKQKKTILKFVLTSDSTAPKFTKKSVQSIGSGEGAVAADAYYSSSKYYVKEDKTIIRINIDEKDFTDKYYWKKPEESIYSELKTDNDNGVSVGFEGSGDSKILKVSFTTPSEAAVYSFQAKDGVGNESAELTYTIVKDATPPAGSFAYSFNAGADGHYSDDSGSITYNGTYVTAITLDFSAIEDNDGGSGIKSYHVGGTEVSLDSNKKIAFSLSSLTSPCVIAVKDNAGNEKTLITFTLTADSEKPDLALADSDAVNGVEVSDVYYVKTANAEITFKTNAEDIKEYKVCTSDDNSTWSTPETMTLSSMKYTFTAPDSVTYYKFYAVDKAGNESDPVTLALVKDATAPALKSGKNLDFAAYQGDNLATLTNPNAVDGEDNPAPVAGDYYISSDKKNVYWNSTVTKFVFNLDNIEETGSGIAQLYYSSKNDGTGTKHVMGGTNKNEMTLETSWTNKTYYIFAVDKAGNEAELHKYTFKYDNAVPEITTGVGEDSGKKKLNSYSVKDSGGATVDTISKVKDNEVGDSWESNVYKIGWKIIAPVAKDTSGIAFYDIVKTDGETISDATGYTLNWKKAVKDGDNYAFTLPETLTTPHQQMALFLRDYAGNVSVAYNISNKDSNNVMWWILDRDISSFTVTDNEWTGANKEYTVSIALDPGIIVKSVAAQGATLQEVKLKYKDDGSGNKTINSNYTSINYIYIRGMEVKIKVEDGTEQSAVKLKINGVEQEVFPAAGGTNPNINTMAGKEFLPGQAAAGKAGTADTVQASEPITTKIIELFGNVFARGGEQLTDNTVSEKPAASDKKSAKKAKKAAEKAAKKAAKKADLKAPEAPVQEQPLAAAAPAAKALESSQVSAVVQQTAAASDEALKPVAHASGMLPEADAVASEAVGSLENKERASSNTAVIVVMIAILSALGGSFFLFKRRKK